MFDKNGETICPKCKNINPEICLFCKGHGKVDWIELAMGGKRTKVWPYYHKEGCGKIMFYMTKDPYGYYSRAISASDVILLDGTRPQPKDTISCPHCNIRLKSPLSLGNFGSTMI